MRLPIGKHEHGMLLLIPVVMKTLETVVTMRMRPGLQ